MISFKVSISSQHKQIQNKNLFMSYSAHQIHTMGGNKSQNIGKGKRKSSSEVLMGRSP